MSKKNKQKKYKFKEKDLRNLLQDVFEIQRIINSESYTAPKGNVDIKKPISRIRGIIYKTLKRKDLYEFVMDENDDKKL